MTRRRILGAVAATLAVVAGLGIAGVGRTPVLRAASPAPTPAASGSAVRGRALFVQSCSSCHGFDARGLPRRGPSLVGVGAQAADFYLSTGRMPLNNPNDPPVRNPPAFGRAQIEDLVAYVGSLGGPPIPAVDAARGDLARGFREFALHCAGCHQIGAAGGIVTGRGGIAPPLNQATATQVAEALRIGPYLMPRFNLAQINQRDVNSIAAYVLHTREPTDPGGWGIDHIGPVPEGMVAWFIALVAMIIVARLIGERAEV